MKTILFLMADGFEETEFKDRKAGLKRKRENDSGHTPSPLRGMIKGENGKRKSENKIAHRSPLTRSSAHPLTVPRL